MDGPAEKPYDQMQEAGAGEASAEYSISVGNDLARHYLGKGALDWTFRDSLEIQVFGMANGMTFEAAAEQLAKDRNNRASTLVGLALWSFGGCPESFVNFDITEVTPENGQRALRPNDAIRFGCVSIQEVVFHVQVEEQCVGDTTDLAAQIMWLWRPGSSDRFLFDLARLEWLTNSTDPSDQQDLAAYGRSLTRFVSGEVNAARAGVANRN